VTRLRYFGVSDQGVATGEVTGQVYRWPGFGSVLDVDATDAPALLAMIRPATGCCGGPQNPDSPLFVLA
jgi:hypothetical protein